jgi:ABC-2 type transport system ATP-binding protein
MKKDDNKPKPKAAIEVKSVSKHFKLPHERKNSLKQHFVGLFSKKLGYEKFEALKDISFTVNEGDFFGIVGRNGSGKSTLLKIISGIYQPSSGSVKINGTLTPFIELGIGFNPELTGRENVYLNGSILGLSKKQIDALYSKIVEFAELEKFMDQKLKNYSSGMQVRLAFSIAIRAQNNILLLDEVLAVGDINFQKKCFNYFQELKRQKKTVIFVTHDMNSVKEYCNKAVLINDSRIVPTTDINDVLEKYMDIMNPDRVKTDSNSTNVKPNENDTSENLHLEDSNGPFIVKNSNVIIDDDCIKISFLLASLLDQDDGNKFISLALKDNINNIVWSYNAARSNHIDGKLNKDDNEYILNIKLLNILNKGNYFINLGIVNEDGHPISRFENILEFSISSDLVSTSPVDLMETLELS